MKQIILIWFYFLSSLVCLAQNPVDLVCSTLNNNIDSELTWILPSVLCGSVNFEYTILVSSQKEGPYTNAAILGSENTTFYTDISGTADNSSYFYIIQSDCDGVFSYSDTLDLLAPVTPEIDYVTVMPNGNVQMVYAQGESPETSYYIIYSVEQGNNLNFDTINDPSQVVYIDQSMPNGNSISKAYTIAAMDTCLNAGPLDDQEHKTIHLETFNDSCDNKVSLFWNLYQGWEDEGFARQELYVSNDGGGFELVDTLTISLETYTYESFNAQNNVAFQIVAVRNGDEQITSSNISVETLEIATIPEYIYPRTVSYDENNSVTVEYVVDNTAGIEVFTVKQSEDGNNFFDIETDLIPNPIPQVLSYYSEDINGGTFGHHFNISVRDSCGIEYIPSNITAIRLNARPVNGFQNELTWNEPILENSFVSQYHIYREEENNTFTLLASNPPNIKYHFDFVGDVVPTKDGSHCYRVEAEYTVNYPLLPSEDLNKFSNIACAIQPAVVYTPNAFAPEGTNNRFKGVVINADISNFTMLILNKWGEVIFESKDPEIGWDGTIKGKPAPEGAYPYYFRFSNFNGVEKEKKGAVMLFR